MDNDAWFDGIVLFTVPGVHEARRLCERLETGWLVWLHDRKGVPLVAASLRTDPDDLGGLLRAVEAWVAERGLLLVHFELDGRRYVLRSPAGALAQTA